MIATAKANRWTTEKPFLVDPDEEGDENLDIS
jgi:hypothetical protein